MSDRKKTDLRERYRTGVNGNWEKPSSLTKRSASEDKETAVFEKTSVIRFPNIPRAHTHTHTRSQTPHSRARGVGKNPVRVCEISPCQQHTHAHKSSFQLSVLWVGAAGNTQSDAKKRVNSSLSIQHRD